MTPQFEANEPMMRHVFPGVDPDALRWPVYNTHLSWASDHLRHVYRSEGLS